MEVDELPVLGHGADLPAPVNNDVEGRVGGRNNGSEASWPSSDESSISITCDIALLGLVLFLAMLLLLDALLEAFVDVEDGMAFGWMRRLRERGPAG